MDLVGTTSNTSFTWLITFERRHHSPPYNILCDSPWGYIQMAFFPETPKWKSKNWDPCYLETLDIHIFFKSNLLEHMREISSSPQNDLSNSVLHAPIEDHLTPTLRGFMIESQILNLTPTLFFHHNKCI